MIFRVTVVMAALALGTSAQAQDPTSSNRCHPTDKGPNAPPQISLNAKPSAANAAQIELRTEAKDPNGDKLSYSYSSTGGRIHGSGADPVAVWDLGGLAPGDYSAMVEVDDSRGCVTFSSVTMTIQP